MPDPILLGATVIVSALLMEPSWPVDTALWGLERSGANLQSFAANVVLEKHRSFEDVTERRFGRLVMEGQGQDRRLGCSITRLITGDRARDMRSQFVYDDGWLGEINLDDRSFIKRQLVEPGSAWDPLKLGEGPLPLPFGQPAAEVRARFTIEPATLPESQLLAAVMRADALRGLRLTPKPGTSLEESVRYVEVFYEESGFMPRLVNLVDPNGDHSMVVLIRPVANVELAPEDRSLLTMPPADPALWAQLEVKEWSAPERRPGS